MSDLNCISSSTCIVKFADDVTLSIPLYYSGNNVISEIENNFKWSDSVGLKLNFTKCQYLLISSSKNCIPVHIPNFTLTTGMKLLRILFSNDGKWDCHVKHISNIVYKRAYALRVLKTFLTPFNLINVYNALVLSLLEYCSPVFAGLNIKNCNSLNSIQRRFHNIICHFNCNCDLFPNLNDRRNNAATKLYIQAFNDCTHLLHNIIPVRKTFFIQPYSRTERYKASFILYTTEYVNKHCIKRT